MALRFRHFVILLYSMLGLRGGEVRVLIFKNACIFWVIPLAGSYYKLQPFS